MNIGTALLVLFGCTALTNSAFAQVAAPLATTPEEAQQAPQTATQHPLDEARAESQRVAPLDPVVFNGGIGLHERASAPTEGTKLEFFLESGAYVSDVHVVVADAEGQQLVNTVTEGPWLILDLPDGEYSVRASFEGHTESSWIGVSSRAETIGYMFPQN